VQHEQDEQDWPDSPGTTGSAGGVRTFHPRRGRMSDAQKAAVADLLPRYGIDGALDVATFDGRPVVL